MAILKIHIDFNGTPTNAVATNPNLKYGKHCLFMIEWDDASRGALIGRDVFNLKSYTDGCGNNIPYTAGLATNGMLQGGNTEVGNYFENVQYAEMLGLINNPGNGWDIVNHSFYHDPVSGWDAARNVKDNDDLFLQRLKYKMYGMAIPSNYPDFAIAAEEIGYIFATSTSVEVLDGYPVEPMYLATGDWSLLQPGNFNCIRRDYSDDWSASGIIPLKNNISTIISESSTTVNKFYKFITHVIGQPHFQNLADHISANANDKMLVMSTREALEYRAMKALPRSESLVGNRLTISIDTAGLSDRTSWKDISFNISSDQTISNVTVEGFTRATFNPTTGLVNAFLRKSVWNEIPDPDQRLFIPYGNYKVL